MVETMANDWSSVLADWLGTNVCYLADLAILCHFKVQLGLHKAYNSELKARHHFSIPSVHLQ